MKKAHIALLCAAAALVIGSSAVYGIKGKNKSEKEYDQQQRRSDAQQEAEEERKSLPILTEGDTDDDRRYGYEVLYRHDGVTITVEELKKHGGSFDLTLRLKNENDTEKSIYSRYFAPNSYISNSDFDEAVEPHSEKTVTVENINDLINDSTITDIRMKFIIYDDLDNYVTSKQIRTYFDLAGSKPTYGNNDILLDWSDDAGIKLLYDSNSYITDDDGKNIGRQVRCFVENYSDTDRFFSVYDFKCYSGGKEVEADMSIHNLVPAYTGHYILLKFSPPEEGAELPDIDRVVMDPVMTDNINFDDIYFDSEVTIDLK